MLLFFMLYPSRYRVTARVRKVDIGRNKISTIITLLLLHCMHINKSDDEIGSTQVCTCSTVSCA